MDKERNQGKKSEEIKKGRKMKERGEKEKGEKRQRKVNETNVR